MHTEEHGYTEVYVPYMVTRRMRRRRLVSLAKFKDDLFKIEGRDLYLIPTAEYPVTNFVRDEIVDAKALPLKFACHSPCFRSEAGSYGKDTRGMIRAAPVRQGGDRADREARGFGRGARGAHRATPRRSCKKLELPYRMMLLCTGDMGFSSAKTYDLEVWLPGAGRLSRDLVVLQLRGLPGAPHAGALPQRQGQGRARAHAERLGPRRRPHARRDPRELPERRRLGHGAQGARALHGRHDVDSREGRVSHVPADDDAQRELEQRALRNVSWLAQKLGYRDTLDSRHGEQARGRHGRGACPDRRGSRMSPSSRIAPSRAGAPRRGGSRRDPATRPISVPGRALTRAMSGWRESHRAVRPMTRVIVVRHGQTHWNVEARIQGHGDSGLTGRDRAGRGHRRAPGREPATHRLERPGRAHETAKRIARATAADRLDARLRERAFGVGEGMSYEELDRAYPGAFRASATSTPTS